MKLIHRELNIVIRDLFRYYPEYTHVNETEKGVYNFWNFDIR